MFAYRRTSLPFGMNLKSATIGNVSLILPRFQNRFAELGSLNQRRFSDVSFIHNVIDMLRALTGPFTAQAVTQGHSVSQD